MTKDQIEECRHLKTCAICRASGEPDAPAVGEVAGHPACADCLEHVSPGDLALDELPPRA